MLLVQGILKFGADHIVRRRDDVAERADLAQVVTDSAKGLDLRHGARRD
jgi:hypothetical protein